MTTRVTIENHSTEPIRVFWVNHSGLEQLVAPGIQPGNVQAVNATPGHELRCRGSLTSILLQVINVGHYPEQSSRVDQPGLDTKPTALPVATVAEESDEAQEAKRAAQESDAVGLTSRESRTPGGASWACAGDTFRDSGWLGDRPRVSTLSLPRPEVWTVEPAGGDALRRPSAF